MRAVLALYLLLAASPAWGAVAWVQDSGAANAASATSVTVNWPGATTANNFILCAAIVKDTSGCCAPITFSDSAGNSYTSLTSQGTDPTSSLRAAYAMNASAATWARATAAGTSDYLAVACVELSGVKTSAAADGFATAVNWANPSNSTAITTTNADDVLIGIGGIGNTACTMSVGSAGYSSSAVQDASATQMGVVLAYKVVAATASYSFDTGGSCGGVYAVGSQIAAFQAASGGAPPAPTTCGRMTLLGVGC